MFSQKIDTSTQWMYDDLCTCANAWLVQERRKKRVVNEAVFCTPKTVVHQTQKILQCNRAVFQKNITKTSSRSKQDVGFIDQKALKECKLRTVYTSEKHTQRKKIPGAKRTQAPPIKLPNKRAKHGGCLDKDSRNFHTDNTRDISTDIISHQLEQVTTIHDNQSKRKCVFNCGRVIYTRQAKWVPWFTCGHASP